MAKETSPTRRSTGPSSGACRPSVDNLDNSVVGRSDDQGQDAPEVPARHDVGDKVVVMRLDGGPALDEHEPIFVVLALKQLKGLAAIGCPANVAALFEDR
jgi:hypothetical protein